MPLPINSHISLFYFQQKLPKHFLSSTLAARILQAFFSVLCYLKFFLFSSSLCFVILSSFILFPPPPSFLPWFPFINSFYQTDPLKIVSTRCISPLPSFLYPLALLSLFYLYSYNSPYLNTKRITIRTFLLLATTNGHYFIFRKSNN